MHTADMSFNFYIDDRTLNQLEVAVKSLLAKLFDEKKILTKVNKGCLILSIQCNDLDAVISLIEDSLSGKLGRFFEPLEELMRTDAGYKLFEVDVGITIYEVSDKCDQRCFTVESIVQDDGIAVRIQVFLQSIKEKENLQQSFSSVEKQEICKKIEELLAFDLDQPGMDMVLLPSIINEGTSRTPPKNLLEKKKTMMHEPLKHRVEAREKIRHSQVKNSSEDKKSVVVRSEYELDSKKLKEGETAIGSRQLMKNERRHWKTGYSKSSKYKDIGSKNNKKHTGVPILFMNHTQMKHEYMNTDDDQTVHSNSSKLDYTPTLPSKGNMQLVNRNGYEEYGSIDGMTVVNDMYLVAADNENMCLRCFHIDTWKQKYWYDCKLKLWDITTVPSNIVAVTTSSNEIWFLHVSGMGALDLKNEISVKQGCYGIASCGDNLIVSYKHPVPGIEILDQNGNVIKVFDKDNRVDELFQFQFPDYLAVSPDLKTIYISDRKKETLNVFNQEGRTLCVVKGNARYHSGNVTVDSAGRMYVCGQYVNTVNLVSPKTGTVTKLLGAKDGVRLPRCVAICESKRRMYVVQ
ncbi:hypothetical protein MAR_031411 [Mya arenaria]|uniref:NHL repeat-containing protein n=1 Tax=Mya arenaria TaxID=6604 RepID=A0ABY7F5E3_MYAAR|nr:hypothetical protein MAR_031411 [Mya arenaria]